MILNFYGKSRNNSLSLALPRNKRIPKNIYAKSNGRLAIFKIISSISIKIDMYSKEEVDRSERL